MDRLQLYKEMNDREWERQAHLLRVTNLCMVAATVLGTALVAVLQGFDYGAGLRVPFLGFAGLSGLALASSLYFVGRVLIGRRYASLPSADTLERHYVRLRGWAGAIGTPTSVLESAFDEHVVRWMIGVAITNRYANALTESFVQKALVSIAVSLTLLAIAAILYLLVQLN